MLTTNQKAEVSFENTEVAFSHFSDKELKKAYWLFRVINVNFLVKIGPPLTNFALKIGLPIIPLIKSTIFDHFCGGETIADCEDNIVLLDEYKVGTILDYSVEGEKNEQAFDATCEEIKDTIIRAAKDNKVPFSVFKLTGIAHFDLLAKLDAGKTLSDEEQKEFDRVRSRVDAICEAASAHDIPVLVDAEESWIQVTIDALALEMMRKYNTQKAIVFNTYQYYRHDRLVFLQENIKAAENERFFVGAKLVRGAYMEKERERAEEMGYPSPIQPNKQASDTDYDKAVELCIANINRVAFMAGTHNEASCMKLVNLMEKNAIKPDDKHVYFAQLLGMSDNISFNLANAGFNVAKYMPYGPVKSVLPYLFRRAQENTAIAGQMGRELSLVLQEIRRRKVESKKQKAIGN